MQLQMSAYLEALACFGTIIKRELDWFYHADGVDDAYDSLAAELGAYALDGPSVRPPVVTSGGYRGSGGGKRGDDPWRRDGHFVSTRKPAKAYPQATFRYFWRQANTVEHV